MNSVSLPPERQKTALELHNPGLIAHSLIAWVGRVESARPHPQLVEFADAVSGLRAMVKVILSFRPQPQQPRPGEDLTADSLARLWLDQPGTPARLGRGREAEQRLGKMLALSLSQPAERAIDLTDPVILLAVVQTILRFEHGVIPYPLPPIAEGIKRAFDSLEDHARRQRRAEYLAAQLGQVPPKPAETIELAPAPSLRAERQALRLAAEALFTKPKDSALHTASASGF
ncbi:MAG: hypothetical protein ORO03_09530 [Alphaproteobacteria bacterium]|nr:hypothetical protein [Alphaproteobacteria bacterium]